TIYPVATVSIQNAVPIDQVGTATGAMNFFRALASTLAVAVMGAILFAALGVTPERGVGIDVLSATTANGGAELAGVFRFVFVAADAFLVLALLAVVMMEERPLRGPATAPPRQPAVAPAE